MDNCLASNSETGGVGCDNMTMLIVGFLNGKTKEEWYDEIAKRVANGDGPCAPPEYGTWRKKHHHVDLRRNVFLFQLASSSSSFFLLLFQNGNLASSSQYTNNYIFGVI